MDGVRHSAGSVPQWAAYVAQTCQGDPPAAGFAQLYVESQVLRLNAYRGLTATMKRGAPGPEGSLGKWSWSDINQSLTEASTEIRGPEAPIVDEAWTYRFLRARANSIEGGTTEILRNIIAERVLGLPKLR